MFSDIFQLSSMFQGREGCPGHMLTGSAGPGAQDNLMACILWMPAEQGMPNCALAIGRSFRLWFIFLSNYNRMEGRQKQNKTKLFKRGTLSLTEWRNGTPLNSPFVWQFVSQRAERINATDTELRMRAATGGQPSVQHSTSCLVDSVVVTWNWGKTGKHACKSCCRNKKSTCLSQACWQQVPSGDFASTSRRLTFSLKNKKRSASQAFKRKKFKSQTGSLNYKGFVWKLPDLSLLCDQGYAKGLPCVTLATVLSSAKQPGQRC